MPKAFKFAKSNHDYQHGHCHYFARELRKQLLKKNPNAVFCIIQGNRDDDDILVHVYVKHNGQYIDSDGIHKYQAVDERMDEWIQEQDENNIRASYSDDDETDHDADIDDDATSINEIFFDDNKFDNDILLKDVGKFIKHHNLLAERRVSETVKA
mgnify:CR=1 FL=1